MPCGLFCFAAYLAVVLSPLMPIEQDNPETSLTKFWILLAITSGDLIIFWQCVSSRKASSTEYTSISGVIVVKACIIFVDISAYRLGLEGLWIIPGHNFLASFNRIPVLIPQYLASYERVIIQVP